MSKILKMLTKVYSYSKHEMIVNNTTSQFYSTVEDEKHFTFFLGLIMKKNIKGLSIHPTLGAMYNSNSQTANKTHLHKPYPKQATN